MLLASAVDNVSSIWNVPSGTTWSPDPHVSFHLPYSQVKGSSAFLGDGSHIVTGSADESLCIWRTSDGVKIAQYNCKKEVCHSLVDNQSIYDHNGISVTNPLCVFRR